MKASAFKGWETDAIIQGSVKANTASLGNQGLGYQRRRNQHGQHQRRARRQAPTHGRIRYLFGVLNAAGSVEVADQALRGGREGFDKQRSEEPDLPNDLVRRAGLRTQLRGDARREQEK